MSIVVIIYGDNGMIDLSTEYDVGTEMLGPRSEEAMAKLRELSRQLWLVHFAGYSVANGN